MFGTNGLDGYIRSAPTKAAASVASVAEGVSVTIECTTTGESVEGIYGFTSIWNQVTVKGVTGWISDAYTLTGRADAAASNC